ncbi:MAG: VOC family virulence protein [Actinomycetia bacterium]|nr:VOC family virulence protein [Actinomycetes bacterium]MCP4225282.1 VOC family virulence protein [Actinomycetes bacterium]
MIKVRGIDHIVFNVADGERALRWYQDKLGLEPLRYDQWKAGEVPFSSLRVNRTTIIDLIEAERSGENINHVALWIEGDIDEWLAGDGADVEVIRQRDSLFGAQGFGSGIYIRDPDGNEIELKQYPPAGS